MAERRATIAGVLLAAGESSRMGQPKPLLPWLGTTLLAYQIEQLLRVGCDPVIVVLGHEADRVAAAVAGRPEVVVRVNADYRQGMSSSIRTGADSVPESAGAILLLAVDQPCRLETLERLLSAHRAGHTLITVPRHQGRRGHPLMISTALRSELLCVSEERQGLREIVSRYQAETAELPVEDADVLINLNTPDDYREALAYFQATR